MENRKRKREPEADSPRIKYHVEQLGRSFERILKEDSHEELRSVVRKKLNLDNATRLELVQLREGRLYDLEDDDDFEAFKAAAIAYSSLDVRVSFSSQDVASNNGYIGVPSTSGVATSHEPSEQPKEQRKKKRLSAPEQSMQDVDNVPTPGSSLQKSPGDEEDLPAPPKKKLKTDKAKSGGKSKTKRENKKGKDSDSMPAIQGEEQEPPKKKKKLKETEAGAAHQDDLMPGVPVGIGSIGKKSTRKQKSRIEGADTVTSPHDTSNTERNEQNVPEATKSSALSSAPSTSSLHASISGRGVDPLSPASRVKSTVSDLIKLPSRTPEDIAALFESGEVEVAKTNVKVAAASTKAAKSKKKVQTKALPGSTPLSESWLPKDSTSTLSVLGLEESSSSPSGSANPPSATVHSAPTCPVVPAVVLAPAAAAAPALAPVPATAAAPIPVPAPTPASLAPRAKSKKILKSSSKEVSAAPASSCPVCLTQPFHYRFICPLIQRGSSAIQDRIEELEAEGGRDELVQELGGWLAKKKLTGRAVSTSIMQADVGPKVKDGPELKKVLSDAPETGLRHDSRMSVPKWTAIGPRGGLLSEVTVESRDEGSEEEESSDSETSPEGEMKDDRNMRPNLKSTSDSKSESATGPSTKPPSVDLENVDLEALIRGPVVKIQLAKLGEESESESAEEASLLDEEDEERRPLRTKGWKVDRSNSPEGVSSDEDQESQAESEPELDSEKLIVADKVNISMGEGGDSEEVKEAATGLDAAISERPKTPTGEPSESIQTVLPPATPALPSAPRAISPVRSPILQQMKDRSGKRPSELLDDKMGSVIAKRPVVDDIDTFVPIHEKEIKELELERSSPSPVQSTTYSTRSPSRTALPATSDASLSRAPSDAPSKRRGRPPLSEAVKAERKAIKDAEKAARAAQRKAKAEAKKKKTGGPVPGNASQKTSKPKAASSVFEPKSLPTSTPIHAASQWKTLAPLTESTMMSQSSPGVDQLMPSSPDVPDVVILGGVDVIKSPDALSVATSISRRHDEDDVERIVGSQKTINKPKVPPSTRQPLFLPGASQMTQTQTVSHQENEQTQAAPGEQSDSSTSTDTGADIGEAKVPHVSAASRLSLPSKSTFPSLSQLSFDKFRPSFLLPGRTLLQEKSKKSDPSPVDESESDDEDSSDEERHSHIPKGRVAGTGVIKKRKSRGLLHA